MDEIRIGSHVLQPNRQLLLDGQHVHLGPRALEILTELAQADSEVVTKDELMQAVWGEVTVEENALQVHVTALRKALGEDAKRLHTLRGIGYQLDLSVESAGIDDGNDASDDGGVDGGVYGGGEVDPPADAAPAAKVPQRLALYSIAAVAAILLLGALAWFAATRDQSAAASDRLQVTVMPFTPTGEDPREVSLASGIPSELIFRLRRVDGLQVITGTEGQSPSGPAVYGSVHIAGDEMRLIARLEAEDGEVLWSNNYSRDPNDLLLVQEDIALSIAGALSATFDVGVESREYGGTDDPEAYASYVLARANMGGGTLIDPAEPLEAALERDPDYIKALIQLTFVDGISLYGLRDENEIRDRIARMERNSERAVELNPDLWVGYAARGWTALVHKDFVAADRAHQRGRELDPGNDPEQRDILASFSRQLGRFGDARRYRQSMAAIDPIFDGPPLPEEVIYFEDYEEIFEMFDSEERPFQPDNRGYDEMTLYWAYVLSGGRDEAFDYARSTRMPQVFVDWEHNEIFPDLPYDELKLWAQDWFGNAGRDRLVIRAFLASQKGNTRLAMDYLRLAFERRAMGFHQMIWHPALAPVRQTQEFREWIEQLGIVDAWRESGNWGNFCRPVSETEFECR